MPRLIAVVVLPTPPFWLATAKIRGGLAGAGVGRCGAENESTRVDSSEDDVSLIAADKPLSGLIRR